MADPDEDYEWKGAEPAAPATPIDPGLDFAWKQRALEVPPTQQAPGLGHYAGLMARGGIQGLMTLPDVAKTVFDVGRSAYYGHALDPTINPWSTQLADYLGLPKPQNLNELILTEGTGALLGGAGTSLLGTGLRVLPRAAAIGKYLEGGGVLPSISGQALGTAAGTTAGMMGASPAIQAIAAAVGGGAGSAATGGVSGLRIPKIEPKDLWLGALAAGAHPLAGLGAGALYLAKDQPWSALGGIAGAMSRGAMGMPPEGAYDPSTIAAQGWGPAYYSLYPSPGAVTQPVPPRP